MNKTIITIILLVLLTSLTTAQTCDGGENPWTNPDDCTKLNLDTVLCLEKDACVWDEGWFIKGMVTIALLVVAYMLYKDLK